jgi:hypothetical protein
VGASFLKKVIWVQTNPFTSFFIDKLWLHSKISAFSKFLPKKWRTEKHNLPPPPNTHTLLNVGGGMCPGFLRPCLIMISCA